jgi:hypothetical protein
LTDGDAVVENHDLVLDRRKVREVAGQLTSLGLGFDYEADPGLLKEFTGFLEVRGGCRLVLHTLQEAVELGISKGFVAFLSARRDYTR